VSAKTPATRGNGAGKGPARGYSWPPFENGNAAARRHAFYAEKFQPLEREEIAETAYLLRSLLPLYSTAFEPLVQLLAARLWRVKRAYTFIDEHAEEDVPRSLLVNLGCLENTVSRDFEALGPSPRSAAALGIDLQRLARASEDDGEQFNWNGLTKTERAELSRLLAKGRVDG
jgi:hypothetical protein